MRVGSGPSPPTPQTRTDVVHPGAVSVVDPVRASRRARIAITGVMLPWLLLVAGLFFNDPGDHRWVVGAVISACAVLPFLAALRRGFVPIASLSGLGLVAIGIAGRT